MITKYTLEAKKTGGEIELEYTTGRLTAVKLSFKEFLTEDKFRMLFDALPSQEDGIEQMRALGFAITKQLASNEKIAMFCRKYEEHKGMKYSVTKTDSGKIKLVKIDAPMLDVYFKSANSLFKNKHSISNLVNFYNELKFEVQAGMKAKHPNGYSPQYEATLKPKEQAEYWGHLRSQGLTPKRDRVGNVTDWIKVTSEKGVS